MRSGATAVAALVMLFIGKADNAARAPHWLIFWYSAFRSWLKKYGLFDYRIVRILPGNDPDMGSALVSKEHASQHKSWGTLHRLTIQ